MKCPICSDGSDETGRVIGTLFTPVVGTPYHKCSNCDLWYQYPFPPKIYESAAEEPGNQMSDRDKAINQSLAKWLFDNVMKKKGKVLDCGAKYSWIGKCFKDLGYEVTAIDGISEVVPFSEELGINGLCHDIEESTEPLAETYDLIILCHVIEHFYKPKETLLKLKDLLNKGGKMFVRCPDSDSEGISRDLNPFHYSIHPCVYNQKSIENLISQTNTFKIIGSNPLLGQRDYILEKLT